VVKFLKEKGFKIIYLHKGKKSTKPYDVIAEKDGKTYFLDVKASSQVKNLLKNFKNPRADVVGFVTVVETGEVYLATYEKAKA
jgi:Holliday junction resolvase